jgi:hypothetical protein
MPFGDSFPRPAAGMGYIFVTENNCLIVVDSGHSTMRTAWKPLTEAPTVELCMEITTVLC